MPWGCRSQVFGTAPLRSGAVAWCVTTAMADYQDLYIERFQPGNPQFYRSRTMASGTAPARGDSRAQRPAGGDRRQRHPSWPDHHWRSRQGYALALRYTALAEPNASFDALLPMLRAPGADEFEEALRPWVDPCNNILFADVHGQIGYRTRGQVPIRSRANAWLPVPGWTGDTNGRDDSLRGHATPPQPGSRLYGHGE